MLDVAAVQLAMGRVVRVSTRRLQYTMSYGGTGRDRGTRRDGMEARGGMGWRHREGWRQGEG